jgi:hypothetical protein
MTLTVPFSKTLDALAEAKAAGQTVYGMTRKEGAYKLDMSERPLSPAPAIKTPPAAPQARETANLGDGRGNPSRIAEQPESESAIKRAASPISAVAAPVMVTCPVCQQEMDASKPCEFCMRFVSMSENAKRNRRNYALEKRYGKLT